MRKRMYLVLFIVAILLPMAGAAAAGLMESQKQRASEPKSEEKLIKEVRHQLILLPYYSVFDNLAFSVDGDTVTLVGQVARPSLKPDAGAVVKSIDGVGKVVNNIEVLPLSPNDDRLRRALFRSIYSYASLQKYALQAVPPIHIIVKNGNVTLVGVVANETDKNLAGIQANSVSGVFSVKNELEVEGKKK